MADTNLADDDIKLVEYTIVDTGRDHEGVVFGPAQVTETRNRTGDSFSAAKIARFYEELPQINKRRVKQGLPELDPDQDDLEVFYQVLERWPRQSRRFQKRKLDRLAEIRDAIRELRRVAAANEAARPEFVVAVSESPPLQEPKKKPAGRKPRKAGGARAKKKRGTKKKTTKRGGGKKKSSKPRLQAPSAAAEPPKE